MRLLVWAYPDTVWASQARGVLTEERFAAFELAHVGPKSKEDAKPRVSLKAETGQLSCKDLKDKKAVMERFGLPDEIVSPVAPSDEEKWIYRKHGTIEVHFTEGQVDEVSERDDEGNRTRGSVSFH